jgi:decaprenyl-phosphate phosphoribosyltransferase
VEPISDDLSVATTSEPVAFPQPDDAAVPSRARQSLLKGLVRAARPKQWPKNLLVAAAPGAAGVLTHGPVLERTILAFVAFCLVASGTYFLNDVRDLESDRIHPVKQHRPIAAGVVSLPVAMTTGVLLLVCGFALALVVEWRFAAVLGVYVAITTSYTLWLKHVAVIDIAAIASGFIIRAVAGGVAARVPISQWFLIVASFGSLFMVAGKRHGEHVDLGPERAEIRPTLGAYPISYLRYVWMISSGVAITAYCLWAFEQAKTRHGFPWYELTIVPFVLAILRYALLLEYGEGSAPEDIVLGDRTLQVLGVVWVAVFACGVYLGK